MSLRIRRGTDAQRQTTVFDLGEPIWTTNNEQLWICHKNKLKTGSLVLMATCDTLNICVIGSSPIVNRSRVWNPADDTK